MECAYINDRCSPESVSSAATLERVTKANTHRTEGRKLANSDDRLTAICSKPRVPRTVRPSGAKDVGDVVETALGRRRTSVDLSILEGNGDKGGGERRRTGREGDVGVVGVVDRDGASAERREEGAGEEKTGLRRVGRDGDVSE